MWNIKKNENWRVKNMPKNQVSSYFLFIVIKLQNSFKRIFSYFGILLFLIFTIYMKQFYKNFCILLDISLWAWLLLLYFMEKECLRLKKNFFLFK